MTEDKDFFVNTGNLSVLTPEPSGWKCYLFGMEDYFVLYPPKGKVPNRFWRWMQYLCFGNRWVKE